MANLKKQTNQKSSISNLLTNRFSQHPERYWEIFHILQKYKIYHVARELGMAHQHEDEDALFDAYDHQNKEERAVALASACEELGPCFIKLGQLLSTRPDILPPHYISALSRLQNTVTPVSSAKVAAIIESELGAPISILFQSFDCDPLATASMAQVHQAVLPDGTEVAVKVQRPGVRQRIEIDLEVLHEVARFATRYTPFGARYGLLQMVRELENSLRQELDFQLEADSERQGERVADTYLEMVEVPKDVNRRAFTQDVSALVSRYHDMSGGRMAMGTALLDLTRIAQTHRAPVPSAMTLLGKAMLNLDGTIRVLSPELDPVQLIRDYMRHVMEKRVTGQISPGRMFAWTLDIWHLIENMPRRSSTILDKVASDQFTMHMEIEHMDDAIKSLNRAANRLSLSIVIASFIIGSGFAVEWLEKRRKSRRKGVSL